MACSAKPPRPAALAAVSRLPPPALGCWLLLLALASTARTASAREETPLTLDWPSCKSVLRPCESKYGALVGDKMKMTFPRSAHTVVLCDEAGYSTCGLEGSCTEVDDGGRGAYILEVPESSRGSVLYVACGQFDFTHCRAGQRMAIEVAAEGTSTKEYPADFNLLPDLPPPPVSLSDNEEIDDTVGSGFVDPTGGGPPEPNAEEEDSMEAPEAAPPPPPTNGGAGVGGVAPGAGWQAVAVAVATAALLGCV